MDPAREYKLRMTAVTDGLDAQAARNDARVAELKRLVESYDKELREASDRHLLTRAVAELAWEDALEDLWVETWITMRPFPRPSPWGKASDLAALNTAVEERSAALRAAVQNRRLRAQRKPLS